MKKIKFVLMIVLSLSLSSCSPEFWDAFLMGMASYPMYSYPVYSTYNYSTYPTYSSPSSSYSSSSSSSTSSYSSSSSGSSSKNSTTTQKTCSMCNGTGRVVKDNATSFGLDKKWCDECKKEVFSSHYHAPCPICHGKGYK